MLIRLKKTSDGVVLSCLRHDGTVAVQRTRHAGFFALHDLMHYSVETVLRFDRAFLGLMAEGWDFQTFGNRDDPRYLSMPIQALWSERLVGTLSRLHRDAAWDDPELLPIFTEEVNKDLAAPPALPEPAPPITATQITSIYKRFTELVAAWIALPLGGHLELPFPALAPDFRP